MRKGRKGFDWYASRQRFSIRKFHFGAASVLLGVSLVLGSGMQLVSAEEATPPITEDLVVTGDVGENAVSAVETSASNQKGEEASTLVKETNKSEEIESLPTRSAQITYVIDYVDESGQIISHQVYQHEQETAEASATAVITMTAQVPEGYVLSEGQSVSFLQTISEGSENRISFKVKLSASVKDEVDNIEAIPQVEPLSNSNSLEIAGTTESEVLGESSDRNENVKIANTEVLGENSERKENAEIANTKVLEEGLEGVVPSELVQEVPKNGVFEEVQTSPRIANSNLVSTVNELPPLPMDLPAAKEVFEQVISEATVLASEGERLIASKEANNDNLKVAVAETNKVIASSKEDLIASLESIESIHRQITSIRERVNLLAVELRKISPDGEVTVLLSSTSHIASGANNEVTDGSDATFFTGPQHYRNYDEADLDKIKRQITWLDFGDRTAWTGLDMIGSDPALKVGARYRKEISPGYVVEITITELKPFESTDVYRDRVKGTDMEWTYNPNAVNSNMKTYAKGKTDYGDSARIIAAVQDNYSNAKSQGFEVPGRVTLRSKDDGGNVGVKFSTKATYLGNVVPLNMVFMSGEEAGNSEFETYVTNGEPFELFGELSNSNTVSSYKVVDNWLDYNDQVSGHSADWKAMYDSRYWANIATEDSLKTAIQTAKYRNNESTVVVDGIGTRVFGPVSNHKDSFFSTPIIMTKNASEVGMYIMSSGRQSAMIGVALLDYGDAPDSYGTGAHSINFNEIGRQPYLGSKPADIDFIPEGIPNGSVPWYRDELINQFDEGPDQLMGSAVESGVNYTLHHSNNGTYALRFTANTNNNDRAYVQGWIDFNNDGRFDESENSGILEVVRGKTEYTLNFKDIYQNVDTSVTKLGVRMRIALEAADIRTPDLTAYSGEVEDFQIQLTHPPRGTKKETIASQGETQTGTVEFFAYGQNTYETTLAKIDEAILPSIVKENGQLVQDSELVDGYYVVPGEGRYKITGNGKDVTVEFIPEPGFVTRLSDGSIIKQAKGITIRRTSTVLNQEGTAAYTTGWTAISAENQLENISEQTNTMDGRYIPHVVAVVPSGVDATSSAVQGAVQTGRPTFVPGTISTGAQVPMDPNTTKLLDDSSNPVDATTAYAMVNGVRTAVGEYRISSTDGTVTYTPNDQGKRYIGSLLPVTVQAKDINGSAATATYTPTITPLSPSAVAATSVGLQGKEQIGRPTFAKGTTIDGVGELVPSTLTLLDASGQPATRVDVPNQGSYVLNPDGSITFIPLPDYYGSPTPVNVRQADSNGSTVVTTYSPNVIEVRPIADPDKTYGLKGAEQTSRSDFFTAGQIDLNGDKVYDPATEVVALNPASRKLINQQGQEVDRVQVAGEGEYLLNGNGTITFTPEPDFVGLANGVTITIADVNGTKVSTTYVPKVIDVPEDELKETVKRTIHYVYADGREARTSVEKVLQYTRTATANPLTGEISYSPWESTNKDFPLVTSPVIPNYTASQDKVEKRTDVPAEAVDETITIVYREHDKQLATFTYRVVDGPELAKDQEIGYSSAPITYTTDAKIAEIIARGYELVEDGFANEANKSFDADTARVQNWDILFRPKTTVTTPDQPKTPGDQVDPSNPDSPRWEEVTKTITRTVSYKLNTVDGPEAPGTSSQTNTVTFERTGTYNFVSNQITYTNWVAKDGDVTLEGHPLPDVLGYTATKATANDEEVLPLSTTRNKTVTHLDNNITEIVVYTPDAQLGKISFINVTDPSQEVLVKEIPLTGKTGDKFTVDTATIIEEFRQQGYEVSDISNYDKEGLFSPDPNSHDEFIYHLTERVVPVDPSNPPTPGTPVDPNNPDGPKWPDSVSGIVTKDEVKRTISYVDEAGAPVSSVFEDTVSFTRTATVNLVTGAVNLGSWEAVNSDKELAGNPLPTIEGYSIKGATSDSLVAEATVTENPRTVEAEAPDIVEVVTYQKDKQEAIIRFVDVTNPQARNELNTITLSGKSSEEIGYDVTPLVNLYEKAGYQVSNKQAYSPATLYDTEKDVPQEFIFELVQKTTTTTPDNPQTPGTPVDPNNPDGPVWEEVTKTITRTVAYKLDTVDGQPAPTTETKTNSVTFERTGSYNHVTKQVTYTDWVAKDGDSTLEGQALPLVTGYVAVTATRNSQAVSPSATAEAIEASATTDNVDEIVVYKALSSWTITPPPGTDPVPPIPYDNHPTDPTKPADPTPTPAIPKVDGYVPVGPDGNELPKDPDGNYIPPVPTDPTQPTVITYKALEQKAVIQYLEEGSNKVLSPADEVKGKSGEPIEYSTAETIALIEERGYELVQDNFPTNATFDRNTTSPQVYTVVFREKVVTTTPDNPQTPGTPVDPTNPDGPVWEEVTKTITRTVSYKLNTVDGPEAPGTSSQTNSVTFERTGSYNHVTKQVTYTDWVAKDNDSTLEGQTLPLVTGYVAVTATRNSQTVTPSATAEAIEASAKTDNVDEIVVYKALSSWTITPPSGTDPVPPIPYGNHPTDPTKPADPTPTPAIPKVDGYVPVGPDGNELPKDPDGNYIPPVPTDPTQPTVITYKALEQKAVIQYLEEGSNKVLSPADEVKGKSGEPIDYSTAETIALIVERGYELVQDNFPTDATFDRDTTSPQIYRVVFREKVVTTTPDNPQTPGTPVDPTNPDGPRWEEVTKTITRTVAYKLDTVDGQPAPTTETKTNSVTFERTGSYNHVTKQVTYTDWVAKDGDSTLEGQTLPLVTGYVAVTATRNSQTVTPSATAEAIEASATTDNVDEIVVYKALSSWTITPPSGTDPVPPIPYGNHPTDPTKPADPTPTPAIPKVDGYVPVGPDGNELPKDPDGNYIPPIPTDPTQPTVITYKALEQKAVIQYLEEGSNKVLSPADEVKGKSGEPIDYSTAETIALIEERGYELVQDNFPTNATYDRDTTSPQVYTVVFREKVVTTTPDNPQTPGTPVDPTNPDGPVWEEVTKTITRTVAYKLDTVDGQPAPTTETKTNSVTFERTGSYNHVTKQVTYTDWVAKDGDSTLEGQTLPLVTGYVAVTATRNSQAVTPSATAEAIEASATTDNVDEIVVYKALSSWTITPPPGTDPVPPIPYGNHPTDPTKPADPTPTPAIPKVDGYVPVGPDGNELPKDPDGNYIPPVPTDPTQPTVITYKALEQKAVIQYLEEGSNKVLSPADEVKGKSGEPIDYSTAETIALIVERGYELVQDNFPTNATFDRDTTSPQVYTVVFREKVVTTTPDNPQTPGTPVDPNNPNGPKWPDGLKESDLNQTVTRTIKYKYEDGSEAQPDVVETLIYKRTATVNLVTKVVTYGNWTSIDDDFDKVDTPAIVGYTPDKASVAAVQDVPATAIDTEVTITYVKDVQKATITYQDENGQQLGGIDEVTGKSGEPINYTTTARITELINQGYEVVTDGFTKEGGQVFDTDKDTPQTFTVVVKAKVVSITPDTPQTPGTPVDPNNPDGPKWPDGLKENDLNKTVIRTILYKYENETSVLAEDGSPRIVKQVVNFQRTARVNIVTGSVTYGEWSESKTVPAVDSPVIKGYITDTSVVPALTITANDNDQTITVVYREIGSWIPNIPGQPVTPIPYPNHPTDPTKPGDEVPTLPHVPGFIPVGPDGVTPLPPVDPDDPSKGYELPPIPTDPGVDTPITYVPEAPKSTTVTVKYVDESGKDLLPPVITEGKVGDSYT
ncbi:TPA: GEVED domain-containing protein, partial [Streptococcus suis]